MADARPPGRRRVVPWWRQRPYQVALAAAAVVVGVVVAFVLVGGGGDAGSPPSTTAARVAPLTGLPADDPAIFERPVLLVKIDNVGVADRPDQPGIDAADVVYEEPVKSTTRLLALFHSQAPERVGPIRSTRFVDAGLAWPFGHAPYVYSGGTPEKVAAIEASPVQPFDETALAAFGANERDPAFDAPHNLFTSPVAVWGHAEATDPPAPLFAYLGPGERFAGEAVASVEVPNDARARYTWDDAAGGWRREQLRSSDLGVAPHLAADGEQVAPENVIVARIAGLEQQSVVGTGEAWIGSQGRMVHGAWRERRSRTAPCSGTTPGTRSGSRRDARGSA